MSSPAHDARTQVAAAARRLAEAGLLIGTAGNVSMRVDDLIAITATGTVLADITPDQITIVDPHGTVVSGAFAPTSELHLHLGIYHDFDAGAIVHTHAPKSTAVGLVLSELPVLHYQQLPLGGPTPVVPFHPFGTPELADAVRAALPGRFAALLANHGAVTHAPTLDQAVEYALLLEWACTLYVDAATIGTPRALTAEEQTAVADVIRRTGYGTPKVIEERT
ncbi:class II aldolase/adducin family protein [Nocardia otitidiscaviarum]|uniref:Class II aldolase/adducin family protein n=1 Tax=Nocardia otitidiscaviarum TaxID=1823 RepID=A0A516NPY0_9NOCA|nr:class II aldolase/adducin family protein [Nocardia otitidiscaviarum]MCP9623751.1 class II aldolase/adducin family protein [Nocardia otitidiscaviarum]QDP80954.1 class II aldolase/adducin family protein [Nocardia otitidiscaviarum]